VKFFLGGCRFAGSRFDYPARQENASPVPRRSQRVEKGKNVMDMSMMMITNHMAAASKRGRGKTFQWAEHGVRDVATRLVAATLVIAIVFAALELSGSRQPGGMAATQADLTASAGRHSLR
jgi:hypothetical protein